MKETLESLKQTLKKELKKIADKGDMTPSELDNAYKAFCLYQMVEERLMLETGIAGIGEGYSGRYYRDGMNYEMPDPYYHDGGSSYRRGRNPMNGQYVSRDYGNGRSGHSIKDRMIANLEAMVDQASSDYERQQILREIEKMRAE